MGRRLIRAAVLAGVLAALLIPSAASGGAASGYRRGPFGGFGTWVDIYGAEWNDPETAVTAMAEHGVKTLYLETGNYSHVASVYRPVQAARFIDAAHAAGVRVVAWYLP